MIYKPRSLVYETIAGRTPGSGPIIYPIGFNSIGPKTFSFWLYPTLTEQEDVIAINSASEWGTVVMQYSWGGHGETLGLSLNTTGDNKYAYFSNALTDYFDTWVHCVIGDDGDLESDNIFFYRNGEREGTTAGKQDGTGTFETGGDGTLRIGDDANCVFRMAHLGYWNRRLEEHEVRQLPYRSPLFVPQGLLFYDYISPPLLQNQVAGQLGGHAVINTSELNTYPGLPQIVQPGDTPAAWQGWADPISGSMDHQVDHSYGDAHETGDGIFTIDGSSLQIESNTSPTNNAYRNAGIWFPNIGIPKDSVITNAYILWFAGHSSYLKANFKLYGNDVDDANDFNDEQDILDTRARTTAYASYIEENITYNTWWSGSVDISSVVEEIVGRSGWVSGNSMAFLAIANTDVNNWEFRPRAYDSDDEVGLTAQLHIEYEGPVLDVDVYPAELSAGADSIDPTTQQGSISLSPSVADSSAVRINPSVTLGDIDLSPSPSAIVTSKSGPQVVLSSVSITPSALAARTAKVDPDVQLGSFFVDPESAIAVAESVDPEIGFTGIDVSPSPAVAVCVGVDPAVDDAQDVITVPSTAGTDTVDPSLHWSSQSATPVPASAGTRAFVDLEYTPAPVTAGTAIVDPDVYIGDALIYEYPDPVAAGTDAVDPSLYFTDCPLYPPPATAGTDSVDPTYYVYGGGYPVVRTSPAITIPVGIPPTTQQGSIALSPDLAEAVTESVDPTLFWTSTSAYPDEAVAAASVVAPIAGVFFRYFMEADISLGEWTNELGSTVDIHESIDEDPADDDDFIQSDWGPDQETYKGKLDRASEPDTDLHHYVEYRYKKENPRERMDMVVRLRQGDSVISGWSHDDIGIDFVTQRQVLSEAEASLITNYQDLYLEFEAWERN